MINFILSQFLGKGHPSECGTVDSAVWVHVPVHEKVHGFCDSFAFNREKLWGQLEAALAGFLVSDNHINFGGNFMQNLGWICGPVTL